MSRYLTFEIVLHNRHNSFYARNSLLKGPETNKTNQQTQHPSCSSYLNKESEDVKEQKTKPQEKKKKDKKL